MKFVSKKREYRAIWVPASRSFDDERKLVVNPGKRAEFMNYTFYTDDEGMIKWLLTHQDYNLEFTSASTQEEINKYLGKPTTEVAKSTEKLDPGDHETKKVELTTNPQECAYISSTLADAIAQIVQAKVEEAFGKLPILQGPQKVEVAKPPRTFECIVCGHKFKNGVDLGRHKKLKHPPTTQEVSPPSM